MNARVQFGLLAAACLLVCRPIHAQGWPPGAISPPSETVVTRQGIMPGWVSGGHAAPCPCPDCTRAAAGLHEQLLPADRGFFYESDHDSRLSLLLRENLRGTWFRLEYLNAHVGHSGRTLGAPLAGVPRPERPFLINVIDPLFDPEVDDEPLPFDFVQVPTTDGIRWNNLNGIRGSVGVPIGKLGWIEGRVWGLEQGMDSIRVPRIPPAFAEGVHGLPRARWLATTLTTDGEPGDRIILYDRDFFSRYTVDVWSADVNFVYDLHPRRRGFNHQALIGYRHEEYGERLTFGGSFENNRLLAPDGDTWIAPPFLLLEPQFADPVSNEIHSRVRNFRNALQVGFRTEFAHQWFTLGVEPKFAFGGNFVRSTVTTSNLREPGDPTAFLFVPDPTDPDFEPPDPEDIPQAINDPDLTVSRSRSLVFAPTFDLGLYAEVHPTHWLTLRAGWSLIWMGRLGVADRSIRFNEVTIDPEQEITAPDVVVDRGLHSRVIRAFTIGGEIILP